MQVGELKKKLKSHGLPCSCEQETTVQVGNEQKERYIVFTCKYGSDKNEIWCRMDGLHISGIKCEGAQAKDLADFCKKELQKEIWKKQLDIFPCPNCKKNGLEPQTSPEDTQFYFECCACGSIFPAWSSSIDSALYETIDNKPLCRIIKK